jgi:hypothetical protein
MSENNDSANYTSDSAHREHKDEENPRFGRGRRGNQEENGQDQDHNTDRKNDHPKGPIKDSNKPDSNSEKNHQNNQENSGTSLENPAHSDNQNQDKSDKNDDQNPGRPEDKNQDNTSKSDKNNDQNPGHPEDKNQDNPSKSDKNDGQNHESEESGRGDKDNEFDGRGRDTQSDEGRGRDNQLDDGRGRDDRSEGGHWRDDKSDGRSERGEFDEECERPEPEEGEEECEPQNPELDQQGNSNHPNGPHHDFSDDGRDHSDRGSEHHLPPGGPQSETPSYRPGFMERTSAYTLTFSNETMFEVVLGSLLILVSAVFLFIYLVKRQRRKTMRSQSPVHNLQLVTPNQNIATANFYQYYQKEGLIPTGTVVGYIPEGQFLQSGAQNLKSFGRLPTQDEILDLS